MEYPNKQTASLHNQKQQTDLSLFLQIEYNGIFKLII